jgi:Tfp pilus assembly protein PilX
MGSNKKGVILFVVLAIVLIVVILSGVILNIILNQSRITHHQVSRIQAYYASKGMMNYALEMVRTGVWVPNASGGANKYACHRNCIDVATSDYTITTDDDIPYDVQVTIWPKNDALGSTVTQLDIKTQFTYTP